VLRHRDEPEVLPLAQRAGLVMVFRALLAAILVSVVVTADPRLAAAVSAVAASHLAVTGALSLLVRRVPRPVAVRLFGVGLLLDPILLQYLHEVVGRAAAVDVAVAANLVVVCLVASFRTGLKIGLWQSLLLITVQRCEHAGLLQRPSVPVLGPEQMLIAEVALLWLVLVATAAAAATNERELRRRRYDAQVLARFAADLYAVERPVEALSRLLRLTVDELGATRALVCQEVAGGVRLVCGEGLGAGQPADWPHRSALLSLKPGSDGAWLVLRLDEQRDPWLARLLPDARRLVVVPLTGPGEASWLVFEHGARSGGRLERRVVATAVQASATAVLAHSRAVLLNQTREAATRDGLTGVANRRAFDEALRRLTTRWRDAGDRFALVLVDVDRFKSINDRLGHPAGDQVLRVVAATLAGALAPGEVAARYGGEEFALLLPGGDLERAATVAERARTALHDVTEPTSVTASFGIATVPGRGGSLEPVTHDQVGRDIVVAADGALLRAKAEGRDRVCAAPVQVGV
jgi:two-component system cell cycle response regulator